MAANAATKSRPLAGGNHHSFDRCFERLDFAARANIVVGVSGGSDSLALLALAHDYLSRHHPAITLHAITIDHGLRAGSDEEARNVGVIAASMGVSHRTVRWEGGKPATGISAAAREARHALLAQAARDANTDLVLMGHTLDDLAETVAMRGARGAGRGDAGIAQATLFDWQTWFARPLLNARRGELRHMLSQAGLGWIDDPSNANPAYERVRVRDALSGDDAEVEALRHKAIEAAATRIELGRHAAGLIDRHAALAAAGLVRLTVDFPAEPNRDAAIYALRIVLATIGGQAQLCDLDGAERLFDRLGDGRLRATLSRAVIDARSSGIYVYREKRGLPSLQDHAPGVWDGRFALSGGARSDRLQIGPAGKDRRPKTTENPGNVPQSLVRAAGFGQPVMWRKGACTSATESLSGSSCTPVVAPWARFMPLFDIEPARAAARLLGANLPPASPFAGHKE